MSIVQSAEPRSDMLESNLVTSDWKDYDSSAISQEITNMSKDFKKLFPGFEIYKLNQAIDLPKQIYNGVRIPIEAFLKSLNLI